MTRTCLRLALLVGVMVVVVPATAAAYVGPGAGFAFVSSIFIIIFTTFLAFLTLLTWPIRWVIQRIRRSQALASARVRRVVVLGLDGQDPELTEQYMKEGILPNFSRLRDQGTFSPLATTLLAESPVAWTPFQTGCNPGKHRIFDFLVPNRKSHLPELCLARVEPPKRTLPLGPFRIPLGKPIIQAGRRSQPFWKILGDHGIFSTILRVPITFPAEKFNGVLLSAMSVPDLNGSQGTYYYFSNDPAEEADGGLAAKMTSGKRIRLDVTDGVGRATIPGPDNSLRANGGQLSVPLEIRVTENNAELRLDDVSYPLSPREYTPWIELDFKPAPGVTVRGIVRFYLLETSPHIKLYMTPINIDPDKPALPISHPFTYAVYLSGSSHKCIDLARSRSSTPGEEAADVARGRYSTGKSSVAQSTAACAAPLLVGGLLGGPVRPQGAEALALTGRRTMKARRPRLSTTFDRSNCRRLFMEQAGPSPCRCLLWPIFRGLQLLSRYRRCSLGT